MASGKDVGLFTTWLQFPVGRVHRHLKTRSTSQGRVGATAAVYSALAGNASEDLNVSYSSTSRGSIREK
uniref:Uncharacterized protein n=1 Tax=Sparus aurata TaxID=8175 RepID=A0A671UTG5_SPAAU